MIFKRKVMQWRFFIREEGRIRMRELYLECGHKKVVRGQSKYGPQSVVCPTCKSELGREQTGNGRVTKNTNEHQQVELPS